MSLHSRLILYYRPTCPFCLKVLGFMRQKGIQVPLKNIGNEETRVELLRLGGKQQVPCLLIDGKALYESDDIIRWLDTHYPRGEHA